MKQNTLLLRPRERSSVVCALARSRAEAQGPMFRLFVFTISLFATTAAWGQTTYNPKIAYAQASGSTQYLYLANADGTGAVRVATVGRDANGFPGNIHGLDFAPGGGRIAYSDAGGIRVLTYTASNLGIKVDRNDPLVSGPNVTSPDFSPDGSRILYRDAFSGAVRVIAASGGVPVSSYTAPCGWARWLRPVSFGNAFACYKSTGLQEPDGSWIYEIWAVYLDANYRFVSTALVLTTAEESFKQILEFDTARSRDALLMVVNYVTGPRMVEVDIISGAVSVIPQGFGERVHYSSDDSCIVYRERVKGGSFINSLNPVTGVSQRLTGKGSYGTTDAQP